MLSGTPTLACKAKTINVRQKETEHMAAVACGVVLDCIDQSFGLLCKLLMLISDLVEPVAFHVAVWASEEALVVVNIKIGMMVNRLEYLQ